MTRRKIHSEQLKNESMQDYVKFLVYAEMDNRNLDKAFRQYYDTHDDASEAWHKFAALYRWEERAAEADKIQKSAS